MEHSTHNHITQSSTREAAAQPISPKQTPPEGKKPAYTGEKGKEEQGQGQRGFQSGVPPKKQD